MADPRARVILEAIRSGNAAFSGFQKDLDAIATRAKIIGAAAAAAITLVVKHSFEAVDALAKEADALGIATDKLAGLKLAAELSGVDSEQLNKALIRQTKTIYDAAAGLTTARRALSGLGLDYRDLIKLSPDQQFSTIAEAIRGVENSTLRAGIAADIYGSRNVALLNTLNLGADGLAEFTRRAEEFGTAVSRVDAAKIEAANDAITLVKERIAGLGNVIAIELAPFITAIARELQTAGGNAEDFGRKVRVAMDVVGTGIGLVLDAFYGWHLLILQLRESITLFGSKTVGVFADIADIATDAGRAVKDAFNIQPASELVAEIEERLSKIDAVRQPGLAAGLRRRLEELKAEAAIEVPVSVEPGTLRTIEESLLATSEDAARLKRELIDAGPPSQALAEKMGQIRAEAQAAAEQAAKAVERPPAPEGQPEGELELIDLKAIQDRKREILISTEDMMTQYLAEQARLRKEQRMGELSNLQGVFGALANLAALNADRSKKSFEFNKKIGIANAIVSTYVGAAKALEGPFPWNLVNAALVIATGLANVRAIRSTSWSGGGAGGSVGAGAGAQTASPVPEQPAVRDRGRSSLVVNVTVQGSVLGEGGRTALAEDLTKLLRDHVERTDDTLLTVHSRNAQDIVAVPA